MKHTPLRITGGFLKDSQGHLIAEVEANPLLKEWLPEIVQAVNSHAELVAALEDSLETISRQPLQKEGSPMEYRIHKTISRTKAALKNVKEPTP